MRECRHTSNTKWGGWFGAWGAWELGLGGGQAVAEKGGGKEGLGFQSMGFMRMSALVFVVVVGFSSPSCLSSPVFFQGASLIPHSPLSPCPAPFPSRAGPGRASPIVSRWASMDSWKSSPSSWRLLLALTSGRC